MKIFWFKAQAPLRVLALAKHLDIDAEFIEIDMMAGKLKTPAYAELNPNMKAPCLVDGEYKLWESSAIMVYLCNKVESDMWPRGNTMEQIDILKWLSWSESQWSQAVSPFYFEHIVKSTFKIGLPDKELLKESTKNFLKYAEVLDGHLKDKDYVACSRLTIADFHMGSMARYWKEAEMPLKEFKNVIRWLDTLNKIPAWVNPWPEA